MKLQVIPLSHNTEQWIEFMYERAQKRLDEHPGETISFHFTGAFNRVTTQGIGGLVGKLSGDYIENMYDTQKRILYLNSERPIRPEEKF